ncbi:hypothetical protein K474DRAFT_1733261, partial [Panus rudis PR-1116 ss-1]
MAARDRPYPLRNRGISVDRSSSDSAESVLPGAFSVTPSAVTDNPQHAPVQSEPAESRPTYSQVVSRTPSPVGDVARPSGSALPAVPVGMRPLSFDNVGSSADEALTVRRPTRNARDEQPGSPNEVLRHVNEDDGGWTTVTYRGRSRSPTHTPRQGPTSASEVRTPLSAAQRRAVDVASASLTAEQKELLQSREEVMRGGGSPVGHSRSPSPGEGTSWRKGKTIDPREWGAVGISPDELDPNIQRRELDMYRGKYNWFSQFTDDPDFDEAAQADLLAYWEAKKNEKSRKETSTSKAKTKVGVHFSQPEEATYESVSSAMPKHAQQTTRARNKATASALVDRVVSGMTENSVSLASRRDTRAHGRVVPRPSNQIDVTSYLGQAMSGLDGGRTKPRRGVDTTRAPASPPPPSPPSSSSSDSEDDSSSSSETNSSSSSSLSAHKKKHKNKKRKSKKRKHCKHKHHCDMDDDRPRWRPEQPTRYDGSANINKFYRFAQESRAYIDGYRMSPGQDKIRTKARYFRQGGHDVRKYIYELETLLDLAGIHEDRDRLNQLWDGFRPEFRVGLLRAHVMPATHTWDEIIEEAQFIEAMFAVQEEADQGSHSRDNNGHHRRDDRSNHHRGNDRGNHSSNGGRNSSHGGQSSSNRHNSSGSNNRGGGDRNKNSRNSDSSRSHERTTHHNGSLNSSSGRRANSTNGRTSASSSAPRLSDKERQDLLAAGKCFICKEAGHMSRNCPRANSVRSSNQGKPPGLASYSIEPTFEDAEALRALSDSAATTEELEANMVELGDWVEILSENDSLPSLKSVSDSESSDEEDDDFQSAIESLVSHDESEDEFADLPELQTVSACSSDSTMDYDDAASMPSLQT